MSRRKVKSSVCILNVTSAAEWWQYSGSASVVALVWASAIVVAAIMLVWASASVVAVAMLVWASASVVAVPARKQLTYAAVLSNTSLTSICGLRWTTSAYSSLTRDFSTQTLRVRVYTNDCIARVHKCKLCSITFNWYLFLPSGKYYVWTEVVRFAMFSFDMKLWEHNASLL